MSSTPQGDGHYNVAMKFWVVWPPDGGDLSGAEVSFRPLSA